MDFNESLTVDIYASEGISKTFLSMLRLSCLRCCYITSHENRSFSFQAFFTFFKIHTKTFNSSKLVNFFLSERCPSLAHSKNVNFIGWECPNREGDGWKYKDIVGKCQFFLKHPNFPNFLWVVIHFIAVICCILNLTNCFREDF